MSILKLILGLVPIIWLIIALSGLKMPGFKACPIAIIFAAAVAIGYKHMAIPHVATAIVEGICMALWPILLVIIAALFVYALVQETGAMDKIKAMLTSVSVDKRVLAIIIGWGFGCFMEGMAGFGTAVAIPAAIMVGMGFDPIPTVISLLIVNTTPTAFGSVGVPTTSLSTASGLDVMMLSANTVNIQFVLQFITPFLMVIVIGGGLKALKGMIPFTLLASLSFTIPNFIMAHFAGSELPDIVGSIICMVCCIVFAAKFMQGDVPEEYKVGKGGQKLDLTVSEGVKAWAPFILIFILLLITSKLVPFIQQPLSVFKSSIPIYNGIEYYDPSADPGMASFAWVNTPGIWIILSGIIGGLIQGASIGKIFGVLGTTIKNNVKTILTICSVLATARIMVHSGMTRDVADVLVLITGNFYPLFAPLVGVLGAFVTGSGTSTGILFGSLQSAAATQIGAAPGWLCAANSFGAGVGKMIAPSNVALACASAGLAGNESKIMSQSIKWVVAFVILGGIITFVGPMIGIVVM